MAGGNPNHDPRTGRFASASGLNRDNSTSGERAKARLKSGLRAAGEFSLDVAKGVGVALGEAALQGATRSVRSHALRVGNKIIMDGYPDMQSAAEAHSASVINKAHHVISRALGAGSLASVHAGMAARAAQEGAASAAASAARAAKSFADTMQSVPTKIVHEVNFMRRASILKDHLAEQAKQQSRPTRQHPSSRSTRALKSRSPA